MCVCVFVCVCTYVKEAKPIRAAPGTFHPSCRHLVCPISPLQWFLLQYKSQPALFALIHTRAHTHIHRERQTCTHTHTSANPLTTHQCPEQIKGLHISDCIPNVPPLHGSPSSSSCTFSSSSLTTTGLLLCTCFCCFCCCFLLLLLLLRSVFNLWQLARLPLQLR